MIPRNDLHGSTTVRKVVKAIFVGASDMASWAQHPSEDHHYGLKTHHAPPRAVFITNYSMVREKPQALLPKRPSAGAQTCQCRLTCPMLQLFCETIPSHHMNKTAYRVLKRSLKLDEPIVISVMGGGPTKRSPLSLALVYAAGFMTIAKPVWFE